MVRFYLRLASRRTSRAANQQIGSRFMAKNSRDVYGASGNTSLLLFDPSKLVIVTDPKHVLYDERVDLPLSEALIANILHHGRVLEPIVVRKNPETGAIEVVAGRQRVRAVREINKRRRGKDPMRVPATVDRSKDGDLMDVIVSENEIREADSALVRAEKMRRLLGKGKTEAEIQVLFGCSGATIKNALALLEASSAVKKAVDSGRIAVATAYKLARMEPGEQKEKVKALLSEAPAAPGRKNPKGKRVREIVTGEASMRSQKDVVELRAMLAEAEAIKENDRRIALATLDWVLGEETIGSFYDVPEPGRLEAAES